MLVFGDVFTELRSNSAAWGRVAANSQFTREAFGSFVVITFTGTHNGANVFKISADELELAQEIRFRVPFGSTTLVNVTGTEYTTSAKPTTSIAFWNGSSYVQLSDPESNPNLEQLRRGLLWNLPDAQSVQIGANLAWQGTLLAPGALVVFPGSTQLNGVIIAENLEGGGSANNHAFNGCLPEPCPPTPTPTPTPTPPTPTPTATPTPEPTPEPPPLPPDPIQPSPPGDDTPPSGGVAASPPGARR